MIRLLKFIWIAAGLVAAPAIACSCWRPEPMEYLAAAGVVFRGTVTALLPVSAKISPPAKAGDTTQGVQQGGMRARFRVAESYKGPQVVEIEVGYEPSNGGDCGWHFAIGDSVTVFAWGSLRSGFATNMCLMLPFRSLTERGDNRHLVAIEEYRDRRNQMAAELASNGPNEHLYRRQAEFFAKYKDYDDADGAYSRLLRLNPKDVSALTARGGIRYSMERFNDALADYVEAVQIDVDNSAARRGRALTLVMLGRARELGADDGDFRGFASGYDRKITFAGANLVGAKFPGTQLINVDFSGADLRNADFTGAYMHTSNFTGARLAGAKFDDLKYAYSTSFNGASLEGASFRGAVLFHSMLANAKLNGADFGKASLEYANLENSILTGANFKGAGFLLARMRETVWDGHDLAGADLRGADLRDTTFRNSSLRGAIIGSQESRPQPTDLRGADLSGADLGDVKWGAAVFDCRTKFPAGIAVEALPLIPSWDRCAGRPPKTALSGAQAFQQGSQPVVFEGVKSTFAGRDLSGHRLRHVRFDDSDFTDAILIGVDMQGGSYRGSIFRRTQLKYARISDVDFQGATFDSADFTSARLYDVDFTGASFHGARLGDACYDEKTKWPKNFSPAAAGARPCRMQ